MVTYIDICNIIPVHTNLSHTKTYNISTDKEVDVKGTNSEWGHNSHCVAVVVFCCFKTVSLAYLRVHSHSS